MAVPVLIFVAQNLAHIVVILCRFERAKRKGLSSRYQDPQLWVQE